MPSLWENPPTMPQHDSLTAERWAQFSLDQQILMIGTDMNRAKRSIELQDWLHEAAELAMDEHLAAFRALLLLNPVAAQQIPYLGLNGPGGFRG